MKGKDTRILAGRQEEISRRLENRPHVRSKPMLAAEGLGYELSGRVTATASGGVPAILKMAQGLGLVAALDRAVQVFRRHLPYHESDHVMSIALNVLAGGTSLEDLELRRADAAYLEGLGAKRIPDPTTARDFVHRFKSEEQVLALMEGINSVRGRLWDKLSRQERRRAILNADGVVAATTGSCKEGMAMSYKGEWGYHPLLVSLANTREALYLVNRPGNAASHADAAAWIDKAIELVKPHFRETWLRGDTDFSLTGNFDRWTAEGVKFCFGYDAKENLVEIAEKLPEKLWQPLARPAKYAVKTEPRSRPENVKERLVVENGYENIRLVSEQVAKWLYRPGNCHECYRLIIVRKNLTVERREIRLLEDIRYFFYISNDWEMPMEDMVSFINDRCDHENDIEQMRNGVRALRMPGGNLYSNWAYMVMAALAWNLKAWYGILTPEREPQRDIIRMEFRKFVNQLMNIPAQVCRQARRIKMRFLNWTPYLRIFLVNFAIIRKLRLN